MDSLYRVVCEYTTSAGSHIAENTVVNVLETDESGWWSCSWAGNVDWLPATYLEKVDDPVYSNTGPEAVCAAPAVSQEPVHVEQSWETVRHARPHEDYYSTTNGDATDCYATIASTRAAQPSAPPAVLAANFNLDSLTLDSRPGLSASEISQLYATPIKRNSARSTSSTVPPAMPAPPPAHFSDDDDDDESEDNEEELPPPPPPAPMDDSASVLLHAPPPPPPAPEDAYATPNAPDSAAYSAAEYSTLYEARQPRPLASQLLGKPPPPPPPLRTHASAAPPSPVRIPAPSPPSTHAPHKGSSTAALHAPGMSKSASLPAVLLPPAAPASPGSPGLADSAGARRRAPPPPPHAVPLRGPKGGRPALRAGSMVGLPPGAMLDLPGHAHAAQLVGDVVMPITTSLDIRADRSLAQDLEGLRAALGGWTAPDGARSLLLLHHHGKLMKVSKGKAQCRDFFLFDRVLVYCRREKKSLDVRGALPTSELVFKGGCAVGV
jgi:hypothetical protein